MIRSHRIALIVCDVCGEICIRQYSDEAKPKCRLGTPMCCKHLLPTRPLRLSYLGCFCGRRSQ